MANAPYTYSVVQLERLWARGDTYQEIAAALGCQAKHVGELRRRHNLQPRSCKHKRSEPDPTPEQIEQRAALIKARNIQRMRTQC
jgi:hypothetical protein